MHLETPLAWPRATLALRRCRRAARVGVGLSMLSLALLPGAAQAALVRFNFALDFSSGPLAGQTALGSFDVEAADCVAFVCNGIFTPSGPANPIVGPTGTLLAFSVDVDGITFAAASDDLYPDFPSIELVDNTLSRIDFMDFSGLPSLAIYGSALGGWGGSHTSASFDSSLIGNVRLVGDAQAIPEPSTLLLVAGAFVVGSWGARRRGPR